MILSRRQISTCMIMLVACVSMAQASCTKKKTALGRRQKFGPEDFVTDSFLQIPDNIGGGTFRRLVTIEEFPVLEGKGIASGLLNIEPCGINFPHIHPRANELFHLLDGNIFVGLIEENGGRVILNNITAGEVTFFEQGLIHFQLNLSCKPARFLAAFNNEDPGTVTIASRLFASPNNVLRATFQINNESVEELRKSLQKDFGLQECLARCNLKKTYYN